MACPSNCEICGVDGCSLCRDKHYLFNNTCRISCPAYTYNSTFPGSNNLTCSKCNEKCMTCVGPGPKECTLCKEGYFISNAECLSICPARTFQSKVRSRDTIIAPACIPKARLAMSLRLTSDPRQILMLFSSSVDHYYMNYLISRIQVSLQNATLGHSDWLIGIIDSATLNLTLLSDAYIPDEANLRVDLLLTSLFDNDPSSEFYIPTKNAEAKLMEFYPFDQSQRTGISLIANLAVATSIGNTIAQTLAIVVTGGTTSILLQFRLITDLIQLLQFINLSWPANTMDLFRQAYKNPISLWFPVSFFPAPSNHLLPNTTVPRALETKQISPIFLINSCHMLSTLLIAIFILMAIKICLQFQWPLRIRQTVNRVLSPIDKALAWNGILQVIISNFPLLLAYSIVQLYYANFESGFVRASWTLSLFVAVLCSGFIFTMIVFAWKYSKVCLHDNRAQKKYSRFACLFEGIKKGERIRMIHVPLSVLRTAIIAVIVVIAAESTWVSTISLCIIQAVFLFYLAKYRPHNNKFEQWSYFSAESCMLLEFISTLAAKCAQASNSSVETRNIIGWAILVANLGVSIITLCVITKKTVEITASAFLKLKAHFYTKKHKIMPLYAKKLTLESPSKDEVDIFGHRFATAVEALEKGKEKAKIGITEKERAKIGVAEKQSPRKEFLVERVNLEGITDRGIPLYSETNYSPSTDKIESRLSIDSSPEKLFQSLELQSNRDVTDKQSPTEGSSRAKINEANVNTGHSKVEKESFRRYFLPIPNGRPSSNSSRNYDVLGQSPLPLKSIDVTSNSIGGSSPEGNSSGDDNNSNSSSEQRTSIFFRNTRSQTLTTSARKSDKKTDFIVLKQSNSSTLE